MMLYWYTDIFYLLKHQKACSNNGARSIFLAPLLQCTSINRCALFMRTKQKKYYFTPLFIKIIFLFSFLFSSRFTTHLSLSLSRYFPLLSQTKAPFSLISQIRSCPCCRQSRPYLHKSRPCRHPWIHLA